MADFHGERRNRSCHAGPHSQARTDLHPRRVLPGRQACAGPRELVPELQGGDRRADPQEALGASRRTTSLSIPSPFVRGYWWRSIPSVCSSTGRLGALGNATIKSTIWLVTRVPDARLAPIGPRCLLMDHTASLRRRQPDRDRRQPQTLARSMRRRTRPRLMWTLARRVLVLLACRRAERHSASIPSGRVRRSVQRLL